MLPWFINSNDFAFIFNEDDNSTNVEVVTKIEDGSLDDNIDDSDGESKLVDEKNCCMFDGVVLSGIVCDISLLILPKVENENIDDDIADTDNDSVGVDEADDERNNFLDDVM